MNIPSFVRVLPENGAPGGTGYLLSADRVLTACHVLGQGDEVAVQPDASLHPSVCPATVVWRGRDDCDLALLRLPAPITADVPIATLAAAQLPKQRTWASRGWSLAAPKEEGVVDGLAALSGTIAPFGLSEKRVQLTVDQQLVDVRQWRGASGAPIFEQEGGRRIVGVLREVPTEYKNVLYATPIAMAFADGTFLEALGSRVVRERRDALISEVRELLHQEPRLAVQTIAEQSRAWKERFQEEGVDGLVDEILTVTDAAKALNKLRAAFGRLSKPVVGKPSGEASEATDLVASVIWRIAPVIVQRGLLHVFPEDRGGMLLRLPVATATIAELVIAALEGRPARMRRRAKDYPEGAGRFLPPQEAGFDIAGDNFLRDLAEYLEQSDLLTPTDRLRVDRIRRNEPDAKVARDLVFELANDEIDFRATYADRPLRRYVLFDEDLGQDIETLRAAVRTHLPALHFVVKTGLDHAAERRLSRPLREMVEAVAADRRPSEEEELT